jgi:hypothetical protein
MWDIRATIKKAGPKTSSQAGAEIDRKQSHAEGLADLRASISGDDFDADTFAPAIPGDKSHRLLFSRDAANQVNIAELSAPGATLFREINGKRTVAELAAETGQDEKAVKASLVEFAASGAVLVPERW